MLIIGEPVYVRFWQRTQGGSWATFDVEYTTENLGGSNPTEPDPQPDTEPQLQAGSVVSWPPEGTLLSEEVKTLYFSLGSSITDEWRVTFGTDANGRGLYDSGISTFFLWELNVIDWATQGVPLARALNDSKVGFSARFVAGAGHSWLGFTAAVHPLFGLGNEGLFAWRYSKSMSFPAIQNASGSGSLNPGRSVDDSYNMNIEWATPQTPFAAPIVDQPGRYEISIRSTAGEQTASITPRRTQGFAVIAGEQCNWTATDNNNGGRISSGVTTVSSDSLLTVRNVPLRTGSGTLLSINCS